MKKILLTAFLLIGFQAYAQQTVNYDYLDLGFDYLETDNSDADGFSLEGSFSITDQAYLGGFYKNLDGDFIDFDRYGLFAGFHQNLGGKSDFYTQLELGQIDLRFGEEFTYGLGVGIRTAFTELFELNTKLAYTHVDEIDDGFFEIEVQGLFNITENFALTAELKSFDGDAGAGAGVRFNF